MAPVCRTWRHKKTPSQRGVLVIRIPATFGRFGAVAILGLLGRWFVSRRDTDKQSHKPGIVAGLLCALGGIFSVWLIWLFPINHLPKPTGPHSVGVADFEVTDHNRVGLLGTQPGEPRTLLVRVFYPATPDGEQNPRPYITDLERQHTTRSLSGALGVPFLLDYLSLVRTNSYVQAPLLSHSETYPTVFYSHGYTSFVGQNTVLMEELASHGYVVYALHHSGDSAAAVLPSGRVLATDPELFEQLMSGTQGANEQLQIDAYAGETQTIRRSSQLALLEDSIKRGDRLVTKSAEIWLQDRQFLLDHLSQIKNGETDHPNAQLVALTQISNFSQTGQMGMSFGGSTSGALCLIDRRCAAGINLDGSDFHQSPFNTQQMQPFMMFYGDFKLTAQQLGGLVKEGWEFNDFSYERHELAGLSKDIVRLKVHDVAHLGISDFNLFLRNPLRSLLLGPIDGHLMVKIQNELVRGFFDTYLKAQEVGFPDQHIALFDGQVELDDVADVKDAWVAEHPNDQTVMVRMETELGEVDIALYPQRAPVSVENFLKYVDGQHYHNASIYRAVYKQAEFSSIGVIQGGLLAQSMLGDGSEYAAPTIPFAPIPHEPTTLSGLTNTRGTIAYARLAPGSAGSEFFFNMVDNEVLDTNKGGADRDGHGYAVFGRVVRGMRVLETIQAQNTQGETGIEMLRGQILKKPIIIRKISRLPPKSHSKI